MTANQQSKLLARWLRHHSDAIGMTLDKHGWTDIAELLAKAAAAGFPFTSDELMQLVIENDKQRFSVSPDGLRIRAAHGHSVAVNLNLPFKTPPPVLYHGTVRKFLAAIRKQGLLPGTRRDVHLSATKETAMTVGARRGAPVVLIVETYPLTAFNLDAPTTGSGSSQAFRPTTCGFQTSQHICRRNSNPLRHCIVWEQ